VHISVCVASEPLVPELSTADFELSFGKLKSHKSPGNN